MRPFYNLLAALALVFLLSLRPAQAQRPPKIGDPAPALHALVSGKPFPAFRPGHVYVLEFWAPWCGPCLAAFPHLNDLTRTLKDAPVTFLSLTDDPRPKVERLLKARPLDTQIAYDQNGKTFADYHVQVIPHTVIIGTDGKIAAITDPQSVTAQVLQDALTGTPLHLPVKTSIAANLDWDKQINLDAPEALAQIIIQRSNADGGASRLRPGSGLLVGDGLGLISLLEVAYDAHFFEIKSTLPDDPQARYRVSIRAPDGKDATARTLLASVLPTLAPFTARWSDEEATVFVLRRIPGTPAIATSTRKPDGLARMGEINYFGVSFKDIASVLSGLAYQNNVIDETGYTDTYDFKLTYLPGNATSLDDALKLHGLQVSREKRPVRRLLVQPLPDK